MAVLRIYGDESGKMSKPLKDNDGIFVTATVSIWGSSPSFQKYEGSRKWLVQQLKSMNAIPFVAFVKPFPGFSKVLDSKLDKMMAMALTTRRKSGANIKYIPKDGINPRNLIWISSMEQAIGLIICNALTQNTIDRIEIVLHQRTFAVEERKLFEDQVISLENKIREIISKGKERFPKSATLFEKRFPTKNSISIRWSDENSESRLKVAHSLARFFHRDKKILSHLLEEGFKKEDICKDITQIILAPLDRDAVEKWQRNNKIIIPI